MLFTNARYQHEWAETGQLFQVAADNVGWRDGRYVGLLERPGRFAITGSWDGIPQFYSVDTKTPYSANGATLTLDDATQRSIQNAPVDAQRLRAAGGAVRHDRTARHRHRRRHHLPDHAAATDDLVQDPETRRRAAVGRELRLQQRRRGGAAVHVAHQRLQPRRGMDATSATCCASPTTARGSTTTTTRSSGTARSASTTRPSAPGRGRMSLWPTNQAQHLQRRRLQQARGAHAVHRLPLLRRVVERLRAAAVHDQQPVAGDRAAARDHRSRRERLLHQPRASCRGRRTTGA